MGKKYSKEDIERIKNTPDDLLTSEERKFKNIIPTIGYKGMPPTNPRGNWKKTPSFSSKVRKLMNDEEFLKTILKSTPSQWQGIVDNTPASMIAAGIVAGATKEIAKSVAENKPISKEVRDLVDLLNKIGYGEKVVHEAGETFFDKANISFNVVSTPTLEEIKDKDKDKDDDEED